MSADICCVQETRFRKNSVRTINGKAARYKFFWIGKEKGSGGVGLFLAKKSADHVRDINRVNARMTVSKVLVR